MKEIRKIIEDYDLNKSHLSCALVSVVHVDGSSYRRIGARMLVYENGICLGGISGGCIEGDALRKAQKVIFDKIPKVIRYDTTEEDASQIGVGLGCQGIIDVLITPLDPSDDNNPIEILRASLDKRKLQTLLTIIEHKSDDSLNGSMYLYEEEGDLSTISYSVYRKAIIKCFEEKKSQIFENEEIKFSVQILKPDISLIMMGHQYDTYPLTRIANEIGWQTTIIGNLLKLGKPSAFEANNVIDQNDHWPEMDPYTAVVIMAHDFETDLRNLQRLEHYHLNYIGLLGPKSRAEMLLSKIPQSFLNSQIQNIFGPAGLDIGANTPEEISLSIIAEIRTHFSKREGGFLKFRKGTIHEREVGY